MGKTTLSTSHRKINEKKSNANSKCEATGASEGK